MEPVREYPKIKELESLLLRLREEGRALQGDGFGAVGDAKAAYKKICKGIEELMPLLKRVYEQHEKDLRAEMEGRLNPDCLGQGADNLPRCTCRSIFLNNR